VPADGLEKAAALPPVGGIQKAIPRLTGGLKSIHFDQW